MAKRKKRVGLPRVTVLAYNRKDLAAFVGAVETFTRLAGEMQQHLDRLTAAVASMPRKKERQAKPAAGPAAAGPAAAAMGDVVEGDS